MTKTSPKVGILITVLLLAAAAAIVISTAADRRPQQQEIELAYWLDTGTSELIEHDFHAAAPITAPSGAPGVRAHVLACGNCDDSSARFTAYYTKYTDEAKQLLDAGADRTDAEVMKVVMAGSLISADGHRWAPMSSPQGQQIHGALVDRCTKGKDILACLPAQPGAR